MQANIKNILTEVSSCRKCVTIFGYKKFPFTSHGKTNSKYMLVSEAPGKKSIDKEDEAEIKYWMGAGGKLLRSTLFEANKELYEEKTNEFGRITAKDLEDIFYLTDIVKCWPNENEKNRKPNKSEITSCSSFLTREIETLKPKLILSLGKPSTKYLLSEAVDMKNAHGKIYSFNNSTKVLVMYHPSNIDFHMKRAVYISQLKNVFKKIIENKIEDIEKVFKDSMNYKSVNKEEVKSKYVNNNSIHFRGLSFNLPASGNEITESDISNNQIRITIDFKKYFPNKNTELKFTHNDIVYTVKFTHRGKRSHILKLGLKLMNQLNLTPTDKVKITKLNSLEFSIDKIRKS